VSAWPAPGGPSHVWWAIGSLGEMADASALFGAWFASVRSRPGEWIALEQGIDPQARPYLRALASPELLGSGPGAPLGVPARIAPAPTPPPLPRVFGRLVWPGRPLGSPPAPPRVVPASTTPGLSVDVGTAVQAIALSHPRRPWVAHVRVGAFGERAAGRAARDRVGLRWAAALGAFYEPWSPEGAAHRHAAEEWRTRSARRFCSGDGPAPEGGLLARVWQVPPLPSPVPPVDPRPSGLLVGWEWGTGRRRGLPLAALLRHAAIVGMTGAGKTQLLAHVAAEAGGAGVPFVLFDLHGDLGPAAFGRLPRDAARRVVVMDGTRNLGEGVLGLDVLGSRIPSEQRSDLELDRLTSEVLSALRPVAAGSEEYWGPRMERFLEGAIRGALESGGTLYDVAQLLHDPASRADEMAGKARSAALRRFLLELPSVARRQPDLLSSSQNRVSKLLLSRTVRALVAPPGGGLEIDELLAGDRSLVVHLPKGSLGELSAMFVANLLLARIYIGLLRVPALAPTGRPRRLLLLDEAQSFSPRLLRSIVEEGRKFGCACVLATQSPARWQEVFSRSPTEAVGTLVGLRLPLADARHLSASLLSPEGDARGPGGAGLSRADALVASLATLPAHAAWVRFEGAPGAELLGLPAPAPADPLAFAEASDASALELASPWTELMLLGEDAERATVHELLLRTLEAEAKGTALDLGPREQGSPAARFGRSASTVALLLALQLAREKRWIEEWSEAGGAARVALAPAGWAQLGYREDCGAPSESDEHRRLIFEAFRIFARRGVLMELPEQGRMDQRTPDGRVRVEPERLRRAVLSLGERLEAYAPLRTTWVWRLGHGRDIFVEAEVSGAERPERIERTWKKAKEAHAFLLIVVGTPERGRKVRRFLRELGVGAEEALIWVVRRTSGRSVQGFTPPPSSPTGGGTR
jgi:hypothetical protein